jgi:hypothetical protein
MTSAALLGFASDRKSLKPASSAPPTSQSLAEFNQLMEAEFVTGSAIHPQLYRAAVQIVPDIEMAAGGEVSTPIHDALGWRYTRFGNHTQPDFYAALLENEDGSTWQAKLSFPRTDDRGKVQKYESPKGGGARAFLPPIPPETRHLIEQRYGSAIPSGGSFWDWLAANPQIPIVLTEGGKKGLAGLSQGYVTLALFGCNGGYRSKDVLGNPIKPYLIPDLERFAVPGRPFILAFDQDENEKTRRRVALSVLRFGNLLTAGGGAVRVAQWAGQQGKGLDDLIANAGFETWEEAYRDALSLDHWQLWQHLEQRLTFPANLQLTSADLSTLHLSHLPEQGIIAIDSAKGTGKTKFMATLLMDSERAIATGHRIALMRNLCQRLGLDYRGDLDKVGSDFITGSAYTWRIGLCVDSVLSIDPQKFTGCDLILDEVVQVIRHLLTSSTCARDGKRPALLARFQQLVQNARRVIVADADLNNATLTYLQQLRGEDSPLFLIRNDYQPQGYPVRFIESPDRSAILNDLLDDLRTQPLGKVVYIATDSKGTSKAIARLIQQQYADKRVLTINSETSGGQCEQAFMQSPDQELAAGAYDIIICSPSVATGVSIESQGIIAKVYGIFTGNSSTDADMAQALGRVREPVERIVWCAKTGNNFSKVSRSTHPLELKRHLYEQTSVTVSLIRSNLRPDTPQGVDAYDWQADPHLNLYCQIAASQNYVMYHLRDALLVRLRYEGHQVRMEARDANPATKQILRAMRLEIREIEAEKLVATVDLTYVEVLQLEQKESVDAGAEAAIAKFYLKDFYGLDTLTVEDVLWDNNGQRRGEILNLEDLIFPDLAIDRTTKSLEKQVRWKQHLCPWDISNAALRRRLRAALGLDKLLQQLRDGWSYTRYDLAPYAAQARALTPAIKVALHLTITDKMSDVQIMHQLLAQMGVKIQQLCWSRSISGHEGEKLRVYGLDQANWTTLWRVVEQRHHKRLQIQQVQPELGSPLCVEFKPLGGDPGSQQGCMDSFMGEECLGAVPTNAAREEDQVGLRTMALISMQYE